MFDAAFIVGTLSGWSIEQALVFGNLCAGLSVTYHGGSLSAPTLGDVARWLAAHPQPPERYGFLESFLGGHPECATPPRPQTTLPRRPRGEPAGDIEL